MQYGLLIDHRRCIGCHACTVACKAENDVPVASFRTWVKYEEKGRFPAIKRFLEQCVMHAQSHGYVETMMGRRRPINEIRSHIVAMRNMAERMAINSVVQGSAADLIKLAMRNVYRRLEKENRPSRMLLQVHDELVFETPADAVEEDAAIVREEMTSAMKLDVPLKVEVGWGKNWQEVK